MPRGIHRWKRLMSPCGVLLLISEGVLMWDGAPVLEASAAARGLAFPVDPSLCTVPGHGTHANGIGASSWTTPN